MARTNELRKTIVNSLKSITSETGVEAIYYNLVPDDAMYPHIVFSIVSANIDDLSRKDYTVDVDVYTKDIGKAMDIADAVEDLFLNRNDPQESILPTFYLQVRTEVDDPDKTIKHIVIRMQTQLYDNE